MKQEQFRLLRAALANRYRVERELGEGGMATVYLARDLKHGRPVALKVLRPEFSAILGFERFLREIQIAAGLQHPNILPLYDSGEADGTLYYIMPYVEGESLRDRLAREGLLPLADALRIAGDVAQGLSYAHAHDVVHRDIKPENILLGGDRAVVADFGIARAVTQAAGDRLTQTGIAVGTPVYMSPEQASAEHRIDGRSDIYSLGCVVYEMLAGHPPFTGNTAQEVRARHSMDAVPSLRAARPNMPDGIEAAICTALEKSPADRFATASQFAAALGGGAQALQRRLPARRLAAGATAAAVLVAVVLGAALFVRRHARESEESSRVVVMPFENRTTLTELDPLGTVVAEWVTQGLTEAPFLTVLDTHGAQTTAGNIGAAATPREIGRATGAGVVIAGSYLLQGDSLEFQARISSTTDGAILLGISGVTASRGRPMAGVERLQQRLMAGLASLHDKDLSTFQTALARPPNYAAYRAYVEGIKSYIDEDTPQSAQHFLHSAVLDSTFLTARIWAIQAGAQVGRGWLDDGWMTRSDSLINGLRPLRERLAPFDQARFDFAVALRNSHVLGEYRAALRMIDAAPGSVDARREAAISAERVLRFDETLYRLKELDPEHGLMRGYELQYWGLAAWAHHMLGQYEDELRADLRMRKRDPSIHPELTALVGLGRIAEADSIARGELRRSHHSTVDAFSLAGELMGHGHAAAAQRLAAYAFAHPEALPPTEQAAAREWIMEDHGRAIAVPISTCYLGERVAAHSFAERARDEWLHRRVDLALLLGDVQAATQLVSQMRAPESHGTLVVRVLAAQGKGNAARAALQRWEERMIRTRGTLDGLGIDRGSALVSLGEMDRALELLSADLGVWAVPYSSRGWDAHALPYFAPLMSDPRFQALNKSRG